jgi:hypothetical protein
MSLSLNSETHAKRQATQYVCLPSLLGDGDKGMRIAYGEEKNILYWVDYSSQTTEQKSLVPARQAQRTNPRKDLFHLSSLSPHSP